MNSGSTSSLKPLKTNNLRGIIIKTVHSVKGGEFDVVFYLIKEAKFSLNYRSNQFINKPPDEWLRYSESSTISSKEHHYEEERRLFYVALTRAKRKLFLLAPKKQPQNLSKKYQLN